MEWEPISERKIMAKFESKCQKTTIIQTYAPTNEAEDTKEEFYYQLQAACNKTRRRNWWWAIDLNAKVG